MQRLKGKSAIVTGAGSGIGRASALLFAREGASVLAVDRDSKAVAETAGLGTGTIVPFTADVGSEEQVAAFVEAAAERFGSLDVVYANAGVSGGLVPLLDQTVEQWEEVLRVNLIGPFLAIKHAAPIMIEQGKGAIVCTASVAGLRANAAGHAYSASKAGVISLVQTVAVSLTGTGVRINAICPGLIETGMTKFLFDAAKARGTVNKIGQLNPTQRSGIPDEIAAMALFLASDEASYVNGQAFPVDGGLSSSHPFVRPVK